MKTKAPTILVVDDIKINYVVLKGMLKLVTTRVLWARNHKEAMDFCKNYEIDLVLMDFQLPEMNGLELSKRIKSINKSLPIIFQTANAHVVDKMKTDPPVYEAILEKPIDRNVLIDTLERYVPA